MSNSAVKREVKPLGVFALVMGCIYSIPLILMFFIKSTAMYTLGLAAIPIMIISFATARTNFWKAPATNVRIAYIGHRCFRVECDEQSLIIDPYKTGSVPGLKPVKGKVNMVLCSDAEDTGSEQIKVKSSKRKLPFEITELIPSNGKGKMFVLDNGDHKIVHLGTLSCPLTDEQMDFIRNADVLMVPVGAGNTINEEEAAAIAVEASPEYVIPMSFKAATYGLPELDYGSGFAYAVRQGWLKEEGNEDRQCPIIVRLAARNGKEKGIASVEIRNRDEKGKNN